MQLSKIITREVETIGPQASVKEAAQRMRSLDVGSLPVCDGRRLLGMVTDRDITIRISSEGRDVNTTPVTEAMTPEIAFVFEDEDVRRAAEVMKERQIRRLPVLDRSKNLVGIVSLGDLSGTGDDRMSGDTLERVSEPASSTHGQRPA